MLTAHQLHKQYNVTPILKNISFSINRGDRLGLIGPNGAGKTTLLRLLTGQELPNNGHVTHSPGNVRVGYLAQGFEPDPTRSIAGIIADTVGDPNRLADDLVATSEAIAQNPTDADLQAQYDDILWRMERMDEGKVPALLATLDLDHIDLNENAGILSGGQKTRLMLALILLSDPQLLILDEPTNHLDIDMLEWLEEWLAGFAGGALIVSHDRTFLDRTVNRILDLNPETCEIREYAGNYTSYLEQVLAEREKQWSQYKDQVYEIRRMKQDIARVKEKAKRKELATKDDRQRRYAKKVAKLATSREKKLNRFEADDERVERPKRVWQVKIDFATDGYVGKDVLEMVDLAVGYPPHEPLVQGLNEIIQSGERVVMTGANGTGKTTLMRTIAGILSPLSGSIKLGSSVRMGIMSQEQELLDPALSALETIQEIAGMNETEARNYLHYYLFKDDAPLRPTRDLSFGERARLTLATLVAQGCNFLLLDEPINHLDIPSRSLFEEALAGFDGTVLAVVHDRYFIERFASKVWWVENGGITTEILRT